MGRQNDKELWLLSEVKIKRGGTVDFTEEIKGQEWFIDEEDETGGYKAP